MNCVTENGLCRSPADLYNEALMQPKLRKAHKTNDEAVLAAYRLPKNAAESDIVRFFKYVELTGG